MNENIIINNENINLNQNNYICQLCNRQIINQVKCLSCKNIFCQICFENYNNKNNKNSCPFGCINPSFKEIINKEKHNNPYLKYFLNNKNKYIKNAKVLKKYNELKNKININDFNDINLHHLSYNFKSIYHSHCLYNMVIEDEGWICDVCDNKFEPKTNGRYRCNRCDFDICLNCRILEESGYKCDSIFLSRYHQHLLKDATLKESNWICDVCDLRYGMKTIKRFRCDRCDFDICYNCKVKDIKNTNGYFWNFLITIFYLYFIHSFCDYISYIIIT